MGQNLLFTPDHDSLDERVLLKVVEMMVPRLGSFPADFVVQGRVIAQVARQIVDEWRNPEATA